MELNEYQKEAMKTDKVPLRGGIGLIVPLLGLAGETGELLSEYKKHLRDGEAHGLFKERVAEELGDLLWYVANVASKFGLDLGDVARQNLEKCSDRWGARSLLSQGNSFDATFPESERLPRKFRVGLREEADGTAVRLRAYVDGDQIGDPLTDNSYEEDGYRFHDVFHLAYAAVLNWSPVIRRLIGCKRKSDPRVDEVEDGGRAQVIEEGVAALAFDYAKKHNFLNGVTSLDYQLLKTIKSVTAHLEVSECSFGDWERAILVGFEVWRNVTSNRGGTVSVDLDARSISYKQ
jgi:NTP pyrophosphatase (non-canonical NTP hydrolase)